MSRWDQGVCWFLDEVTPPDGLPVDVAYVRDKHLRVTTDTAEDDRILRAITTATGQAQHFTGRSLVPQTWEVVLNRFPSSGVIVLPRPPLIEVVQITYQDENDATQTLATTVYRVVRQSGPHARPSWVDRIADQSWPGTFQRRDAVRVQFRAGYVEDPSVSPEVVSVPGGLKEGIAMRAAELYKQRSDSVIGFGITVTPAVVASRSLWHDFKVY